MKKILLSLLIMALCPFLIIGGNYILSLFRAPADVMDFAKILGGIAVAFIFSIATALLGATVTEILKKSK